MRSPAVAVLAALAACGPKVAPAPPSFDEDLGERAAASAAPPDAPAPPPIAPPGPGLREGTIARDRLLAVLEAGPAAFLRRFEVTARMRGDRFVGWELVQLVERDGPLAALDLAPGDVLLAVNGKPIARPDQLQGVWDALRTANQVTAELRRGDAQLTLAFTVEPAL
jgi:membrane-associated protease RseP (regulator of RpoE activity)